MHNNLVDKTFNSKNSFELEFIVFTILLYLYRTTIPILKYPFLIFFIGLLVYSLFINKNKLTKDLITYLSAYHLSLILFLLYFVPFIFSNKIYLSIFKDIINAIIIIIIYFLLNRHVKTVVNLNKLYDTIIKYNIIFGLFIAIILLFVFFNRLLIQESQNLTFLLGLSVSEDYNFAVLPVIFAIIGVLYHHSVSKRTLDKWLSNSILVILSMATIFSGSRRGIIALVILIILLIFSNILALFKISPYIKKIGIASKDYLIIFFLIISLIVSFVFFIPTNYKKLTFEKLGINSLAYLDLISVKLFKYVTIISPMDYNEFRHSLWIEKYNSYDPTSGWNQRIGNIVTELEGINVEILPNKAKGFKMDRQCDASTWNNNAYSYTEITNLYQDQRNIETFKNSTFQASVFCYVSEDFNGTWARISAEGQAKGEIIHEYDLTKKGTWQKLIINFTCYGDLPPVYLYWAQYGATDFSNLTGYVIYAYPEYKLLEQSINKSAKFYLPTNDCRCLVIKSGFNPFGFMTNYQDKNDPIRSFFEKIITEDTIYYDHKNNLKSDSLKNSFFSPRITRWKFAKEIYIKEYKIPQKLFGGGFKYLNWFGFHFLKQKKSSDGPHNPFLSILLYSGIFGLFIYIIFLFKSITIYLRFNSRYSLFFIFFIFAFGFSFFSSGSPFDPPVLGFYTLLPFLINNIHKNWESNDEKNSDNRFK